MSVAYSPTFGEWVGVTLTEENHHAVYVPPGFAHGLWFVSEVATQSKCTDLYAPQYERTVLWSDPRLAIDWPLSAAPILSEKDQRGCPPGRSTNLPVSAIGERPRLAITLGDIAGIGPEVVVRALAQHSRWS